MYAIREDINNFIGIVMSISRSFTKAMLCRTTRDNQVLYNQVLKKKIEVNLFITVLCNSLKFPYFITMDRIGKRISYKVNLLTRSYFITGNCLCILLVRNKFFCLSFLLVCLANKHISGTNYKIIIYKQ